jgi:hypothetical protein
MLKFNKAVYSAQSTEWNYENAGSLAQNTKGRKIKFSKKNLASTNRVTLLISDKSGQFEDAETLVCTAPLSGVIRRALSEGKTQKEVLAACCKLDIQVDKDDATRYFLMQPQGDGEALEAFAVDSLNKQAVEFADIVAF